MIGNDEWQSAASLWNKGQFEVALQQHQYKCPDPNEIVQLRLYCDNQKSIIIGVSKTMKLRKLTSKIKGVRLLGQFNTTTTTRLTLASIVDVKYDKATRKYIKDLPHDDNGYRYVKLELELESECSI